MPVCHDLTVHYTAANDGIHLACRCGWRRIFPDIPSLDELNREGRIHRTLAEYQELMNALRGLVPQTRG